ncbi:MAG: AAA family ATPase [Proteobacteria bacterium]|nr:AAA family ATPase [Pseudomonadota bacterium]
MFRTYFGIEENPFSNTPDPNYLYMSERHQEALAHLQYGVQGSSGFVLLTGEVGTGKTTICRCLVEQLPDNIDLALCLNPRLSEAELLATICDELGIDTSDCHADSVKDHMDVLNKHLLDGHARGRRAVLIIDEAQNLGVRLLEQVRLLTNLETASAKLLQVILIGQPELRDLVGKPELRQLSQRITARYHLEPMTRTEAENYIRHRLQVGGLSADVFQPGALREVYSHSGGIPRLINSICERSLLGAYAAGTKSIDARLVHTAAGEVLGKPALTPRRKTMALGLMAGGAAAAVIAGILFTGLLDTDATMAPKPSRPAAGTHEDVQTSPVVAARLDDTPEDRGPSPAPGGPAATPEPLDRAPPNQVADKVTPGGKGVPHTPDREAEVFSRLIAEGAVAVFKAVAFPPEQ